ncbi:MAG: hypothetical protein GY856_48800, partial [bacterium]|nr:hypothetical protein [bacterium]
MSANSDQDIAIREITDPPAPPAPGPESPPPPPDSGPDPGPAAIPDRPEIVSAGASPAWAQLQRDPRGIVVGQQVALGCTGDSDLMAVLAVTASILTLGSGVELWSRDDGDRLVTAPLAALPAELRSSRLDGLVDALRLAGLGSVVPYIGGAPIYLPYTGTRTAFDLQGAVPDLVAPCLVSDQGAYQDGRPWTARRARELLLRMRPAPR